MHLIEHKLRRHPIIGRLIPTTLYASYDEALKSCSLKGYENDAIIDLIVQKRRLLAEPENAEMIKHLTHGMILLTNTILKAVTELNLKKVRVIDFGGSDGGHYLQVRRYLSLNIELEWIVVETPAMADAMQEFTTSELRFIDDFDKALDMLGGADVLHTSGTLQSVPQPYVFLEKFCNTRIPYLVFNRQSLVLGDKELVSVQLSRLSWHGWSIKVDVPDFVVKYPHTSIRKVRFEDIVTQNYDIITQFYDNSGVYQIGNHRVEGISYVLVKKNEQWQNK